jgi:D-alanyl-D-alanine carboxypeptidase
MKLKTAEKRKTKIRPARTAIFLLVTAAVVCALVWGGRAIVGLIRDGDAEDALESVPDISDISDTSVREDAAEETEEEILPTDPNARFSELYFYDEARQDRYIAYEDAHPELSPADVVWRVDVDIDKPFYEDTVEITDTDSEQALVNKHFKFPDDFVPAELVSVDGDYRVTPATKDAYERLRADAAAAGYSVRAASAYRSIEYQVNLYARYMNEDPGNADNYSARPGFSEHHTGRTIDLVGPSGTLRGFVGTNEAEWVRENAWKYGFIVRYTLENEAVTGYESEPWHITYIGDEAATLMHENDIGSLEEYVAKYVLHTPPQ